MLSIFISFTSQWRIFHGIHSHIVSRSEAIIKRIGRHGTASSNVLTKILFLFSLLTEIYITEMFIGVKRESTEFESK